MSGSVLASGASRRKSGMANLDSASAMLFVRPGTWRATTMKLCFAHTKNSLRRRHITVGDFDVPDASSTQFIQCLLFLSKTKICLVFVQHHCLQFVDLESLASTECQGSGVVVHTLYNVV